MFIPLQTVEAQTVGANRSISEWVFGLFVSRAICIWVHRFIESTRQKFRNWKSISPMPSAKNAKEVQMGQEPNDILTT